MAAGEQDRQGKKTDARIGNGSVLPHESTQRTKQEVGMRSLRDHITSVQTKKPWRMTDDREACMPLSMGSMRVSSRGSASLPALSLSLPLCLCVCVCV